MMSSPQFMTKKQVAMLLVVSVLGGCLLGSASTYIFLTQQPMESAIALDPPSGNSNEQASISLPGDGVYLLEGNKATQISRMPKGQPIDIQFIPTTTDQNPSIAIQGNDIPVGQLILRSFKAGFGIDADFTDLGATVKTVFDGSPAQLADIQPGDVIVKVEGERPNLPNVFTPGRVDIFGPMEPSVEIELVRGTTSFSMKIPRTYLHPSTPYEEFLPPYAEDLTITTKGSYVVLTPKEPLTPGVYRLEVPSKQVSAASNDIFASSSTATPSPVPDEATLYYWVFLVTR